MDGEADRDDLQREAGDDRRHDLGRSDGPDETVAPPEVAQAVEVTELAEVTEATEVTQALAAPAAAQAATDERADALAERIRAAAEEEPLADASPARALPAVRRATVVRLDARVGDRARGPLPVALRRAAVATRDTLRNPVVAASVAALASVAAQVGLRLLDQRSQARSAAQRPAGTRPSVPPMPTVAPAPLRGWVRITETRSVIVQQVTQHPPYGQQHPPY